MTHFGKGCPYPRVMVMCAPEKYTLAARALQWLMERPEQKDAILAYGENGQQTVFYVKRNKSSVSVMQDYTPAILHEENNDG